MTHVPDLQPVLSLYGALCDDSGAPAGRATELAAKPMTGGLINDTYSLGDAHVLQRLNPVFAAAVNDDIAALTMVLRARGVPVPMLCAANDGRPFIELDEHNPPAIRGVWRVMTRLDGATLHRFANAAQAHSAATMVGRFHRALGDVQHTFAFTREGAHDTNKHMRGVDDALSEQPHHRLATDVARLRDELHRHWRKWDGTLNLPTRICHGDLKASNLLFDDASQACAILDLDTMAHLSLDIELGDALRSWCNIAAEDSAQATFDFDVFEAAVRGYIGVMGSALQHAEAESIVAGLLRICLELSARFAADAVRESYFGWSEAVAPTRGDHNLMRALGQLDLAQKVSAVRSKLENIVAEAMSGGRSEQR